MTWLRTDPATFIRVPLSAAVDLPDRARDRLMLPGVTGGGHEAYLVLDLERRSVEVCRIESFDPWELVRRELARSLPYDRLPYGYQSHEAYASFLEKPHSGVALSSTRFAAAMKNGSYLRIVDLDNRTATRICTEGIRLTSSTYSVDSAGRCLYFADWPISDTIEFHTNQDVGRATVRIMRVATDCEDPPEVIASIEAEHYIHDVAISPTAEYVAIVDMAMTPKRHVPRSSRSECPKEWDEYDRAGLRPSDLVVLDLSSRAVHRVPSRCAVPAHVQYDPRVPSQLYLSGHNISKVASDIVLHGPATVAKFELTAAGPQFLSVFSDVELWRMTSHRAFERDGRSLVAMTAFPNKLFVLDGSEMQEALSVRLYESARASAEGWQRVGRAARCPGSARLGGVDVELAGLHGNQRPGVLLRPRDARGLRGSQL